MSSLLLDSHVLYWFGVGDPRIPRRTLERLQTDPGPLAVSVATILELALAFAKGRWPEIGFLFPGATGKLQRLGYAIIPIEGRHAETAAALPRHHADPWDRLLVATAIVEGLTLVTADRAIQGYPVDWLWS